MDKVGSQSQFRAKYVVLDRDGTLIVERQRPLVDPSEVEFLEGATEGLRALSEMGFRLLLFTNQSGVGRGSLSQKSLTSVHEHLRKVLEVNGIILDGIYVCPHAPWDDCQCRKPRPELLYRMANDFGIRASDLFVIGDKISDIDCGRSVGADTILVRTGYGKLVEQEGYAGADHIVDNLDEAAQLIERIIGVE